MTPFPNYRGCLITQSEMTEEARRPQVTFIIYTRWVTLITNVITVKIRTLRCRREPGESVDSCFTNGSLIKQNMIIMNS